MRASLVTSLAVITFSFLACGGDDETISRVADREPAIDAAETCDYSQQPEPHPHPENEVRVNGGATCEEANELFFHPAPSRAGEGGSIDPKPLAGWICEQESLARYGPTAFECTTGPKRVRYLFH